MANYEDNRIRCSKATAEKLKTINPDDQRICLDFRKALGLPHGSYIPGITDCLTHCVFQEIGTDLVDFGFCTRWYSDLETIIPLIERYHDLEWWINQEDVDIYHYYWENGEVIEDVHRVTDEEGEYLQEQFDRYFDEEDSIEHYHMLFTEIEDQSQYVNVHPDKCSPAYREYTAAVRRIAQQIADEGTFYGLQNYDYHWTGGYFHFWLCLSLRLHYLYETSENLAGYKLSVMSEDVAEAVRELVFPYNKQLYDAIFGLAIGDALGVPYEFMPRGSFTCRDMTGYGTHHQPAGTWSDDTSMTLATLRSLKDHHGRVIIEDIRRNFLRWLNESEFTAGGSVFDIGGTTCRALKTGIPGSGEFDNGNGSLMRILPLAFTDCTDEEIEAVSAITHAHWISKKACVIYVHVARRLLQGEDIDDIIPTLKYDPPFDRLCRINALDASEIKSSGYVVDTLEAALWAVSHKEWDEAHRYVILKDYGEDVKNAINLGGDTDTVGALTGGLAGMIYGLGYYGEKWFTQLKGKEQIYGCLWDGDGKNP